MDMIFLHRKVNHAKPGAVSLRERPSNHQEYHLLP
jgi:hypothetical protein